MKELDLMDFSSEKSASVARDTNQRWYALYQVIEKPAVNSPSEQHPSGDDDSVTNASLFVLASNLSGDDEISLRIFMAKKVAKGPISVSGPSLISTWVLGEEDDDNRRRYSVYSLLFQPPWVKDKEESPSASSPKGFLVCLASPQFQELELFQNELDAYCQSLGELLDENLSNLADSVTSYLEKWNDQSIQYIVRGVDILEDKLNPVLHGILVGARIELEGFDEDRMKDLRKLIEACKIQLVGKTGDSATGRMTLHGGDGVKITSDLDEPPFFCQHWASQIFSIVNSTAVEAAVPIRNVIEDFKLKLIQDVNGLRRLVQQAKDDYYALFKALTFLKHTGYPLVLLNLLKHQSLFNGGDGTELVLEILEEFLVRR